LKFFIRKIKGIVDWEKNYIRHGLKGETENGSTKVKETIRNKMRESFCVDTLNSLSHEVGNSNGL
jgi:hypothetical protein